MNIRFFVPEDRDLFFELCKQFYESEATLRAFDAEITEKTFRRILDRHENSWGIIFTDKITAQEIGYALLTSYWSNEDGGNVMVLDELYIRPTERHKGYARSFMLWMEETYKDEAVSITMEVLTTNVKACDLYNRMGYRPDGFTTYTKSIKQS